MMYFVRRNSLFFLRILIEASFQYIAETMCHAKENCVRSKRLHEVRSTIGNKNDVIHQSIEIEKSELFLQQLERRKEMIFFFDATVAILNLASSLRDRQSMPPFLEQWMSTPHQIEFTYLIDVLRSLLLLHEFDAEKVE
jgi:hypothetical protein